MPPVPEGVHIVLLIAPDRVGAAVAIREQASRVEAREAAVAHAYTHEVLGPIKATMEEGGERPEVYFSESYLQQAGRLAQLRAAAAGRRLAALWREGIE